jgi:hypothetical protein
MTKKNEFAFTISFDCEKPNHIIVADKLNSLGRKKASFIAKAVMAYIEPDKSPVKQYKRTFSNNEDVHIKAADRQSEAVSIDANAINEITDVCKEKNDINATNEFMSNLSDFG